MMPKLNFDNRQNEKAPASAFALVAGSFAASQGEGQSHPIQMLARSGNPIDHWYWGKIVHDFASMNHRERIAVDYEHFTSNPIGYIDKFEVRDGDLWLTGSLESLKEDDTADEIIKKSQRGIPYQASIQFDPEQLSLEYIPEGMFAEVNGREVEGPAVVVHDWHLRGVAVTPHGYDINTESQLNKASQAGAFSLNWSDSEMKTESKTAPAEAKENTADEGKLSATEQVDYKAVAAQFSQHFGNEAGFGYFSEGLSLEQAALKHCDVQQAQIDKLSKELAETNQKLAAAQMSHGESETIDTGKPDESKTPSFASLFKQHGSAS